MTVFCTSFNYKSAGKLVFAKFICLQQIWKVGLLGAVDMLELKCCREDLVVQEDYYFYLNNLSFTVNYNRSLENNVVFC
jgi:hypothetical protein